MPRSGLKPAGIAEASSGSRLSRSGHAGGFCSSDPALRYVSATATWSAR